MEKKENQKNEKMIATSNGFEKPNSTIVVGYPLKERNVQMPSTVITRSEKPEILYIYKAPGKEVTEIKSVPRKRKQEFPVTSCNKIIKANEGAKVMSLKSVVAAKKAEDIEDDEVIFVEAILMKDKPPLATITLS